MIEEHNAPQPPADETPLQGWKEIAAYLERHHRTARRWEAEEGLPVRRHRTDRRSSVYAYPSELDHWRASREPASVEAPSSGNRQWVWAALAAVFVLGAFGLLLRGPRFDPIAEAGAAGGGVRTTELCRECDTAGKVSPDGRYLSETDWLYSGEIGIRDLQTGEFRRLGPKKSWAEPMGESHLSVFSPDGKQIAYNWLVNREGKIGYELRTIDAFGEHPESRVVFYSPELNYLYPLGWTRDDRVLVGLQRGDWSTALGFISIDSGKLTTVKSMKSELKAGAAVLSPDERWIAYDGPGASEKSGRDLYLLAADGSDEKRITTHEADDFVMGFSPDSRMVLFSSDRTGSYGLWGAPIASDGSAGKPSILMRDIGSVRMMNVLASGALVYQRGVGSVDLYRAELDLKTGKLLSRPQVLSTKHQGANKGPWLSPDGRRIAYFAAKQAAKEEYRHTTIQIHDLSSGREREIGFGGMEVSTVYQALDWSPDSQRILAQARDEQNRWNLCEIDVDTGELQVLIGNQESSLGLVGWSADGRELIYHVRADRLGEGPDGRLQIRKIEAVIPGKGKPRTIYTVEGRSIKGIKMSQRRDKLAWVEIASREAGLPQSVKVMTLEDGKVRTVVPEHPSTEQETRVAAWSADGTSLLLSLSANSYDQTARIEVLPLDGSTPKETELVDQSLANLAMHPDGKTVLFQPGYIDVRAFKTENYLPAQNGATE